MVKKLYDFKKRYERIVQRIKESKILIPSEKKLILEFDKSLVNQRTSEARREGLLIKILLLRRKYLNEPLDKATNKQSIEVFCQKLNSDTSIRERTRSDFKAIIKQFYRWYNKDTLPDYVAWIRRKQLLDERQLEEKTKEDLLSTDEQKRLINATKSKRNYALIKLGLETGMRPAEILKLKVKHIDFGTKRKNDITMITVPSDTKTGSRKIPIIASVKALADYLNKEHPYNNNPESWLWVQEKRYRDQPLTYKGYSDLLSQLKNIANIKKRFHAYIFRYTSYTTKARAGWSEQKIKAYHGLSKDSKILSVYVKMDAEDLIDDVLELAGKKVIKISKTHRVFIVCPRCEKENDAERKFCTSCSMILDLEEAQKITEASERDKKGMEARLKDIEKKMELIDRFEKVFGNK